MEQKPVLRCILFIFFSTSFSFSSMAQSTDAGSIVEKTSEKYKQWESIEVDFDTNIRWEKNNTSESFEGKIIMKNDKFYLSTPDMQTWFDGTTQWTFFPRNREVNIGTPEENELKQINPMLLFQNYSKDFNVEYIGESTSHNMKSCYDIAMIPKKKDDIDKIQIQIDKTSFLPEKLIVTTRQNVKSTITVKSIKQNKSLTDDMFVFPDKEHPDVEKIDLR
jgi:outer membrane lipoprotein-sorting protein